MTLSEALALFLVDRQRRCVASIVRWYRSHLSAFVEFISERGVQDLGVVTLPDLNAHLDLLRSGERRLSPVTIHKRAAAMRTFFRWCVKAGVLEVDPSAALEMPKVGRRLPKSLRPEEVRWLLGASMDARERAVIELLLDSGLRLSECAALTWGDLDFDLRTVHVRHGKGDKERYAVIGDQAAASLLAWRRCRLLPALPGDRVFTGERGDLTSVGLYKVVKRVAKRAGVVMGCHTLRHTFAKSYLDAGGSIYDLSRLLGHSDIRTTTIYASVAVESLSERHRLLSPVNRHRGSDPTGGHRSPDRRSGDKIVRLPVRKARTI